MIIHCKCFVGKSICHACTSGDTSFIYEQNGVIAIIKNNCNHS